MKQVYPYFSTFYLRFVSDIQTHDYLRNFASNIPLSFTWKPSKRDTWKETSQKRVHDQKTSSRPYICGPAWRALIFHRRGSIFIGTRSSVIALRRNNRALNGKLISIDPACVTIRRELTRPTAYKVPFMVEVIF